jgi:hypothetical protein
MSYQALTAPFDEPLEKLPKAGVSFFQCLQNLPKMKNFCGQHGIQSLVVRGRARAIWTEMPEVAQFTLTIHPGDATALDIIAESIRVEPPGIESATIQQLQHGSLQSGMIVTLTEFGRNLTEFRLPGSAMLTKDELVFMYPDYPLNEFGLYYVALYLAANFARYYPDRWLADVERANPLALAVEELLTQAEERIPLLALSELARNYFVPG